MRVIIDRFEGNYAVCEKEDQTMVDIHRSMVPAEAKIGDVLVVNRDSIVIDVSGTNERKKRIRGLMDTLWE